MNVRITPRGMPNRTELYGGVSAVQSDGAWLVLQRLHAANRFTEGPVVLPMQRVAEIALDDEPGDWF